MSQMNPSDAAQEGFVAGQGLLAVSETLDFNMNEQYSGSPGQPLEPLGADGGEGPNRSSQLSQGSGAGGLVSTMKLVASLGLLPADFDALVHIPEENISVETLPRILMELKSRKGGDRRTADSCEDIGSVDPSSGQSSFSAPPAGEVGNGSTQDDSLAKGGGTEAREGQHSDEGPGKESPSPNPILMQRRVGSPSQGKIQDFLGAPPPMFPYVCCLCDFDVHSTAEWNQHINGLRHVESRKLLVQMYPDWDPGMASIKSVESVMETSDLSSGGDGSQSGQPKMQSRVVVAKYARKPLNNRNLFDLAEPFGKIREYVMLNNKAYLEMDTHQQAVDMVNYYQNKPAVMDGKPLTLYVSQDLMEIEDKPPAKTRSQVVFFANLPRDDKKKMELLNIARRFGSVEKHLFVTDQAFIQLGTHEDAKMMVKYYTVHPLTIRGRQVRLNICTKYKTLSVNRRGCHDRPGEGRGRRGSPGNRSSSSDKKREERKPAEESGDEVAGVMDGDEGEEEGDQAMESDVEKDSAVGPSAEPDPRGAPEDEANGEAQVETEGSEAQDHPLAEAGETPVERAAQEVHGNTDEFVTLDELGEQGDDTKKSQDDSSKKGMRVVIINGFKRSYGFLERILELAKPFGNVEKHLVLDGRCEAFLQFETEDQAKAMVAFYTNSSPPMVCGRLVRVNHSMKYQTIQSDSSRSKVVFVGKIPSGVYTNDDILRFAKPFGRVIKYSLNRVKRECFIEMDSAEQAERMADYCRMHPPIMLGKALTVYVSRKFTELQHGQCVYVHPYDKKTGKRDSSMSAQSSSRQEPPAKKMKKKTGEEEQGDKEEVSREEQDGAGAPETEPDGDTQPAGTSEGQSTTDEVKGEEEDLMESGLGGGETRQAPASLPLAPYDPNTPIGIEYVKRGYYCSVCLLFYSKEEKAKRIHCSSQTHYDKLKSHLERRKTQGTNQSEAVAV